VEIEVDHSEHSKLRELIVEHLFIGEALRKFWRCRITDIEVLRSEIDSFGYDLVMSRGEIIRHIQLKTVKADGKADEVKVSLKLMKKPSGCIVWIVVDPTTLKMESFLWFGNAPGEPLPDIADLKVAIHTKGDARGKKKERKDHRFLKRSRFEKVKTLDDVLTKLFGALPEEMQVP
jgi:hypothetical protein